MSIAIRTGADTVVRTVARWRQELRAGYENALKRPGADHTYADADDGSWQAVDWPSVLRRVTVLGREVNLVDTGGSGPPIVFAHGLLWSTAMYRFQIAAFRDRFR